MEKNWLLPFTYVALIILNVVFYLTKYLEKVPSFLDYSYRFIDEYFLFFGFLEFIGVASVFVDIIVNYDKYSRKTRNLRLLISALFGISFLFKFFINYVDATLVHG